MQSNTLLLILSPFLFMFSFLQLNHFKNAILLHGSPTLIVCFSRIDHDLKKQFGNFLSLVLYFFIIFVAISVGDFAVSNESGFFQSDTIEEITLCLYFFYSILLSSFVGMFDSIFFIYPIQNEIFKLYIFKSIQGLITWRRVIQ